VRQWGQLHSVLEHLTAVRKGDGDSDEDDVQVEVPQVTVVSVKPPPPQPSKWHFGFTAWGFSGGNIHVCVLLIVIVDTLSELVYIWCICKNIHLKMFSAYTLQDVQRKHIHIHNSAGEYILYCDVFSHAGNAFFL
jgi:hypothetical protein